MLPPDFRKAVRESSGGERILCIGIHERWKCLTGFGLTRVDELDAQLDREEEAALRRDLPFDRELRSNQLFGFSKVPFDDSGRFVMPTRFFRAANIGDRLYFQGGGAFFTVWNPEELDRMGEGWEGMKLACADCEAEATAGRRK